MRRGFFLAITFLAVVSLFFSTCNNSFAAKEKNSTLQNLTVLSNEGIEELNGSILNPNHDEANVVLSKQLLAKIRKTGLKNISF